MNKSLLVFDISGRSRIGLPLGFSVDAKHGEKKRPCPAPRGARNPRLGSSGECEFPASRSPVPGSRDKGMAMFTIATDDVDDIYLIRVILMIVDDSS